MITPALANYLSDNGINPTSAEGKLLLTLASSAIGAGSGALADGGAGATSGASTAAYSTTYNYLNHVNIEKINAILSQASCSQRGGDSACVQQAKDYASKANMANDQALEACLTIACIQQNVDQMSGGTLALGV